MTRFILAIIAAPILCILVWYHPFAGFIVLVFSAILSSVAPSLLRITTASKENQLWQIIRHNLPITSKIIRKPFHKNFFFFLRTRLSQQLSIHTAGVGIVSVITFFVSIIGLIRYHDFIYVLPLLASIAMYVVASWSSRQLNYPLWWLMNLAPKITTNKSFAYEHVALAMLVVILNSILLPGTMQWLDDSSKNKLTSLLSEREQSEMWQCCSKLLSGYNEYSRQCQFFEEAIDEYGIQEELDKITAGIEMES